MSKSTIACRQKLKCGNFIRRGSGRKEREKGKREKRGWPVADRPTNLMLLKFTGKGERGEEEEKEEKRKKFPNTSPLSPVADAKEKRKEKKKREGEEALWLFSPLVLSEPPKLCRNRKNSSSLLPSPPSA